METSVKYSAAVSTKYTVFMIPKKEGTVRFIKEYREINKRLFRKLYPLPRIGKTIHQLEGFQYATVLDLRMGEYTITISPSSQDITTIIVSEFIKFSNDCRYVLT